MPQITSFEGKSVQPTSEVYPIANKWLVSVYVCSTTWIDT